MHSENDFLVASNLKWNPKRISIGLKILLKSLMEDGSYWEFEKLARLCEIKELPFKYILACLKENNLITEFGLPDGRKLLRFSFNR